MKLSYSNSTNQISSATEWPEAWLMPEETEDLKALNKLEPNIPATMQDLSELGIAFCKLGPNAFDNKQGVSSPPLPKSNREYSYANIITLNPDHFHAYDTNDVQSLFNQRSLSRSETICYVLVGSGFLDVRCYEGRWVRMNVRKGDLLTLPEDLYHRFTADEKEVTNDVRYFAGQPFWTPLVRIILEDNRTPAKKSQSIGSKGTARSTEAVY